MYQLSVSLFKGSKRYLSYNRSQYKPLVQKKTNELILKKNKLSLNAIRSYSTADNNFSDIYDELDNLDDFYDPSLDAEIAEEEYGYPLMSPEDIEAMIKEFEKYGLGGDDFSIEKMLGGNTRY